MKKNVLVFGVIAGLICSVWMLFSISFCNSNNMSYEYSMVLGYAAMLIAFSMIFVCIKNYRDKYNGGVISFGKAFRIGLYIALIASTIYVVSWMIDYYFFVPDFPDKYAAHMIEAVKKSGGSQAEIDRTIKQMADFKEMIKNPLMHAMMTYAEILPVGLLVSLIAAAILKRKQKPAMA